MSDLINQAEAATILRVSVRTIARYAKRPDLPKTVRPNLRSVLYRHADVRAWAKSNKVQPHPEPTSAV